MLHKHFVVHCGHWEGEMALGRGSGVTSERGVTDDFSRVWGCGLGLRCNSGNGGTSPKNGRCLSLKMGVHLKVGMCL